MDNKKSDTSSARNLFSKVERISFAFQKAGNLEIPCISLYFNRKDRKQADEVFGKLAENLQDEELQLSVIENGGDFLTVTFLWASQLVLFVTSPDLYFKAEWKQFRSGVFYGDRVRLYFVVTLEEADSLVIAYRRDVPVTYLTTIYYEYQP